MLDFPEREIHSESPRTLECVLTGDVHHFFFVCPMYTYNFDGGAMVDSCDTCKHSKEEL